MARPARHSGRRGPLRTSRSPRNASSARASSVASGTGLSPAGSPPIVVPGGRRATGDLLVGVRGGADIRQPRGVNEPLPLPLPPGQHLWSHAAFRDRGDRI